MHGWERRGRVHIVQLEDWCCGVSCEQVCVYLVPLEKLWYSLNITLTLESSQELPASGIIRQQMRESLR